MPLMQQLFTSFPDKIKDIVNCFFLTELIFNVKSINFHTFSEEDILWTARNDYFMLLSWIIEYFHPENT